MVSGYSFGAGGCVGTPDPQENCALLLLLSPWGITGEIYTWALVAYYWWLGPYSGQSLAFAHFAHTLALMRMPSSSGQA